MTESDGGDGLEVLVIVGKAGKIKLGRLISRHEVEIVMRR